jgi:hypothetical protein
MKFRRRVAVVAQRSNGVFLPADGGTVAFHALRSVSNIEVAELLQTIVARVLAFLQRAGVIEGHQDPTLLDDGSTEPESALAALAAAAVSGVAPAGPEQRLRLCKYILRPPLAQERLHLLDNGLVRVELRRAFSDGTVAADMDTQGTIRFPTPSAGYSLTDRLHVGAGFVAGIVLLELQSMSISNVTGLQTDDASLDTRSEVNAKDLFVPGFVVGGLYSASKNLDLAPGLTASAGVVAQPKLTSQRS